MVKNLIFLGAPGVGKGTVAELISKQTSLKHISTGDLFRENVKNKTKLGKEVESIMASGQYVSDELVNKIVIDVISNKESKKTGFILDGFPRTINQAQFLINENILINEVILLTTPKEIIIQRLSKRRICLNDNSSYHLELNKPKVEGKCDLCGGKLVQRPDDKPKAIIERLKVYNKQTKVLIDFYKERKILHEYSSIGDPKEVASKIIKDFL